jgi:hypothetical protein
MTQLGSGVCIARGLLIAAIAEPNSYVRFTATFCQS